MIGAAIGALLIGLTLGLLGSGGSILTVPVLVYGLGHAEKVAIAESLAIVGAIAAVGAVQYALAKGVVWRTMLFFAPAGIMGTFLGAWAASFVSGAVQLLVFGCVMIFAAVSMWKRSRSAPGELAEADGAEADGESPVRTHRTRAELIGVQGLVVGTLTGFVGVGGGFLIVPALVVFGRLDMHRAVGTSLALTTINALAAFLGYQRMLDPVAQPLDWGTVGLFIAVGTLGSVAGKRLNAKVNQRALRKGFAVFLGVLAPIMIARELLRLSSG